MHQPRPKYPHRPRALSKGALGKKHPGKVSLDLSLEKSTTKGIPRENHGSPSATRRASWDPLMPTPRRVPRPPLPVKDDENDNDDNDDHHLVPGPSLRKPQEMTSSHSHATVKNSHVEINRVFAHFDGKNRGGSVGSSGSSSHKKVSPMDYPSVTSTSDRFNTQSSSGSSVRTHNLVGLSKASPSARSNNSSVDSTTGTSMMSMYQAVVGYIGSVDLPEIEETQRLRALSACVRRLRMEKRVSIERNFNAFFRY